MSDESGHVPVLFDEVMENLAIKPGAWYLDLTFGRGGHTRGILARGGKVIAFDQDEEAIAYGKDNFKQEIEDGDLILLQKNFEYVAQEVKNLDKTISGALADFGVSSNQLSEGDRGFSFQQDAPLDMRMSLELGVTAKDLVNALGKKELMQTLTEFAQEDQAYRIVDAILKARKIDPIETTKQLAQLIEKKIGRHGHLHPATKTFMALRMLVNDEIGVIERMLPQAFDLITPGGRLAIISFHEGEDRIIKQFSKKLADTNLAIAITKRPIMASIREVNENNRSRSAKLRILEKSV